MTLSRGRDPERELASIKRDIARWKRSTLAQDAFRRGWRGGYNLGRRDEAEGAPPSETPAGLPGHSQTLIDGVEVDERLALLLHTLWALGLDTQFSCQGDPERHLPNHPSSWDNSAQIFFANLDHAIKFVKKAKDLLDPSLVYSEGGFTVKVADGIDTTVLRGDVRFSPNLIDPLTRAWRRFHVELETSQQPAADHPATHG